MRMQRARGLMALTAALFLVATTALPSAAATTTTYSATFLQEQTVQRTCPPGVPAGAFCFTGSDHSGTGTSSPPVPPDIHATEDFAGFVDFSHPLPNACLPGPGSPSLTGFPDHNVVTLGTYAGRLFLTTDGTDCMSTGTDDGTWHIIGGTGIFEGATGSGHVHTQAIGGTGAPNDPIRSMSTYSGTITLVH
jgi:hypothetical protein